MRWRHTIAAALLCLPGTHTAHAQSPVRALDAEAQQWLASSVGQKAIRDLRSDVGPRVRVLLHLPSGRVAAPAPSSLPENVDYQLAVVVERTSTGDAKAWTVDVDVTTCAARDTFRIKGDFKAVTDEAQVGIQSLDDRFALLPVGRPLTCGAGDMEYTLQLTRDGIGGDAVKTAWRIRPVYHLIASVGSGFDFGSTRTFAPAGGHVTMTERRVGLSGAVGFIWYPGGVDFENMRAYQHFLNPFVLFDLNAPKDGFVVGTAITPSGGLSLGLGASVRKIAMLKSHKVRDAFVGEGNIPTDMAWSKDGVGVYVGLIFDTSLFGKLKGLVSPKKSGRTDALPGVSEKARPRR